MRPTLETDAERAALAAFGGDVATVGARDVPGHYEEPGAADLDVEGSAPTFRSSRTNLAAAGVVKNSTIDAIRTHDGRSRGPFRVVTVEPEDDGAFLLLGLHSAP